MNKTYWLNSILLLFFLSVSGCNSDGKPGLLSSMGYHVGPNKVWIKRPQSGMEMYSVKEVVGADPKTFYSRMLENNLGRSLLVGFDEQQVFWGDEIVAGADKNSFEYVDGEYFKDKNYVYHLADRMSEDVDDFEMYDDFGRDATNVYFGGRVFSDDAANFSRVGPQQSRFYRDRSRCWFFISQIQNADQSTLQYVDGDYAKDGTHVFYQSTLIETALPGSFRWLEHEFSCDEKKVFFQSLVLQNADPNTFQVLDERTGIDKERCFYNGRSLEEADARSFRLIDKFYAADANRVWLNGILIKGADPESFRVVDGPAGKSRDAKYEYEMADRK